MSENIVRLRRESLELLKECEATFLALESIQKSRDYMAAAGIKCLPLRTRTWALRMHMVDRVRDLLRRIDALERTDLRLPAQS